MFQLVAFILCILFVLFLSRVHYYIFLTPLIGGSKASRDARSYTTQLNLVQ